MEELKIYHKNELISLEERRQKWKFVLLRCNAADDQSSCIVKVRRSTALVSFSQSQQKHHKNKENRCSHLRSTQLNDEYIPKTCDVCFDS
jgi:hypothetical protein